MDEAEYSVIDSEKKQANFELTVEANHFCGAFYRVSGPTRAACSPGNQCGIISRQVTDQRGVKMLESGFQNRSARNSNGAWNVDRRAVCIISPPPYRTTDGEVDVDRRSCIDRRSNWIRDFVMVADENATN